MSNTDRIASTTFATTELAYKYDKRLYNLNIHWLRLILKYCSSKYYDKFSLLRVVIITIPKDTLKLHILEARNFHLYFHVYI